MIASKTQSSSNPEDEEMDPVGKPYPKQGEVGTDVPEDPEAERVVQPEPLND